MLYFVLNFPGNQDTEGSQHDGSEHGEAGPLREQVCEDCRFLNFNIWRSFS